MQQWALWHSKSMLNYVYCDLCTKAFNNLTSLVCHKYQHREHRYVCACGASFAFSSQLHTHSVVHRRHASNHCVYPNCQCSFKNQGDLKRHAAEHYRQPHECPDCDNKNSDIRNLESHHLSHTDIDKYICEKCGKGFRYNTQYRRHLKDPSKCIVPTRSKSLEF